MYFKPKSRQTFSLFGANCYCFNGNFGLNNKITVMNKLPDLHKQAFKYKNTKKLQRDGGRAWIKDSQLFESRRNANGRLITVQKDRPVEKKN